MHASFRIGETRLIASTVKSEVVDSFETRQDTF